ncbi:beta-N-acetylhexosaminidase [Actinorhabdospora filicis]|uniref:beta-N-acetylhexosaminidase n=1 Tax=Actinorhabdospora filicis TaxID=1785913 RepID=A0A9W6W7K5_9ACTN|nr:beta-N-acetylhexosaminidase [Actinorhabdospora filicis]GLZ76654.1 beta-N-acetylhexosaminidase [Actinorhabdospora filicis]
MSLALVPQPLSVTEHSGTFLLDGSVSIVAAGDAQGPAWLLHDVLRAGTGFALPVTAAADGRAITFALAGERPEYPSVAAERYTLEVSPDSVVLTAAHPAGLVRAVQTLRQVLPASTLRKGAVRPGTPVEVPAVSIEDRPRFAWRGMMLDVGRHFLPKVDVLRQIDLAALHQLNVFHLHLTEDQGWRIEIPSWPKLTEIGSWRPETVIGHARSGLGHDGTPHGGFYTLDDLREIVSYAAERHITVVPEIDLPGHVRSVLAAYPELGNRDVPGREDKGVATTFGIFDEVLAPTDEAVGFIKDVLDVVVDVFPSEFIHVGGDEVPRTEWRTSPYAQQRAAELGLASPDLIQSWFTKVMGEHLAARGRKMIGWDEVLDGGAPHDAAIMVWRDFSIVQKALNAGHQVVVAPCKNVYLDYYQSIDPEEPLRIFGLNTVESIAKFEPIPDGASAEGVLGLHSPLWSEYSKDRQDFEYSLYPRLSVIADVAWGHPDRLAAEPILDRLAHHAERLDALGVNYRPLAGPRPWQKGGTGRKARYDADYSGDFEEHLEELGLPPI